MKEVVVLRVGFNPTSPCYNPTHACNIQWYTCTKMNLSTVKWAQWDNPIQRTVRSVHMCMHYALHCAQLLHAILHRTDLIIFSLTVQTITTTPMMSTWGKGNNKLEEHCLAVSESRMLLRGVRMRVRRGYCCRRAVNVAMAASISRDTPSLISIIVVK